MYMTHKIFFKNLRERKNLDVTLRSLLYTQLCPFHFLKQRGSEDTKLKRKRLEHELMTY